VSFDAVAPWYRTLETIAFGRSLQRARVACLPEIGTCQRALIVGEGNGRFLGELLRAQPAAEVHCVDASERMLALARQRIGDGANRVSFLQRDITTWTPPEQHYDLIVTHFFLDCFPRDQLAGVVENLARAATNEALWLVADFNVPPGRFARWRAGLWLAGMYRFFRVTAGVEANELADPSPFLGKVGLALGSQYFFRSGLIKSELWRSNALGSAGC
jgi:ubiquinone/menaquinone biosynthesis C-methylase UbiE